MYNRYIPQPDGSFQKQKLQEPQGCHSGPSDINPEITVPAITCEPLSNDPPDAHSNNCSSDFQVPEQHPGAFGIGQFLKSLIPKGLDVEDLMVILLLLLISGDKGKDGNTALFTLGAYLFLC